MKKIIFGCLFLLFMANCFSQSAEISSAIDRDDMEKWAYELFVKNNEKSAKKICKIPSDDYIFYGTSENLDVDVARMFAQKRAEQQALEKLNQETKAKLTSATFFSMELVKEDVIEIPGEDEENSSFQVFRLYRIPKNVWDAGKKKIK